MNQGVFGTVAAMVLAATLMGGCASPAKQMDAKMAAWEGRSVSDAVREYGLPSATQENPDGSIDLTWRKTKLTREALTGVFGGQGVFTSESVAGDAARVQKSECVISMQADPQGTIVKAEWLAKWIEDCN